MGSILPLNGPSDKPGTVQGRRPAYRGKSRKASNSSVTQTLAQPAEGRAAFLAQASADDDGLRRELEALLDSPATDASTAQTVEAPGQGELAH